MRGVMEGLFGNYPAEIGGFPVAAVSDYRKGIRESRTLGYRTAIDLPPSEMIGFTLENGASVVIRPSGTEPKMKIYLTAKESTAEKSGELVRLLARAARRLAGGEA
jgi:phosphoglucomutase